MAGTSGLQIFRFNGASPIAKVTGLLANVEIDHVAWDKNNHLFAIGQTAGKMYVFTVTPTAATEVSGSPYAVSSPTSVAVHPL